uniref:Reverse transcriptase Ty1/copia-type domain-containing protein n=1 Tax=Moniliophthora roreri TaxID=221103 RepID=A0A0W0GE45_MONRR
MPTSGEPLFIILGVHVDDGLCCSNSTKLYLWLISSLEKEFVVLDLGPVKLYLGIMVIRDRECCCAYLTQQPYIKKLLNTYNMTNAATIGVSLCNKINNLLVAPSSSIPDAPTDPEQTSITLHAHHWISPIPGYVHEA